MEVPEEPAKLPGNTNLPSKYDLSDKSHLSDLYPVSDWSQRSDWSQESEGWANIPPDVSWETLPANQYSLEEELYYPMYRANQYGYPYY